MGRRWISLPRSEGETSRQAHADLPKGSYERELGKEGFFGPATHMYHRHPPTGWTSFDGPLRPRAFDAGDEKDAHVKTPGCSLFPAGCWLFANGYRRLACSWGSEFPA